MDEGAKEGAIEGTNNELRCLKAPWRCHHTGKVKRGAGILPNTVYLSILNRRWTQMHTDKTQKNPSLSASICVHLRLFILFND